MSLHLKPTVRNLTIINGDFGGDSPGIIPCTPPAWRLVMDKINAQCCSEFEPCLAQDYGIRSLVETWCFAVGVGLPFGTDDSGCDSEGGLYSKVVLM